MYIMHKAEVKEPINLVKHLPFEGKAESRPKDPQRLMRFQEALTAAILASPLAQMPLEESGYHLEVDRSKACYPVVLLENLLTVPIFISYQRSSKDI